jgi:hypothetical protein
VPLALCGDALRASIEVCQPPTPTKSSFFAAVFPKAQILAFFVIPLPAWLGVSGFFLYDFYSAWRQPNRQTASAGQCVLNLDPHCTAEPRRSVGGAIAGGLYYLRMLRRF